MMELNEKNIAINGKKKNVQLPYPGRLLRIFRTKTYIGMDITLER